MKRLSARPMLAVCGVILSACASPDSNLTDLDSASMNEIMLNFADPDESVKFFSTALAKKPDEVQAKRNMAAALARANRFDEAVGYYAAVDSKGAIKPEDRLTYADALLRIGDVKGAQAQLQKVPTELKSYEKSRLAAILADNRRDWSSADHYYAQARSQTVQPAAILNNWGVSKLSRGAYAEAEQKFREAISFDRELFAAKDNLIIARGRQRNYTLPILPMTETERAELLHDLGVVAMENGDTDQARDLMREALQTHPQHFEAAAAKLSQL